MKNPSVYIMASHRNGTLYTGVTSDLHRRVEHHKHGQIEGFTKKYKCHTLVFYETFDSIGEARLREKQIKAGSRKKKIDLIEKVNPEWNDLSCCWI